MMPFGLEDGHDGCLRLAGLAKADPGRFCQLAARTVTGHHQRGVKR